MPRGDGPPKIDDGYVHMVLKKPDRYTACLLVRKDHQTTKKAVETTCPKCRATGEFLVRLAEQHG